MAKSYVYILCNKHKNVVYVGSTDNLKRRIYFHKMHLIPGFTDRYNVDQLVYYEEHASIEEARMREAQIKKYRRQKKDLLVQRSNPQWIDLFETIQS